MPRRVRLVGAAALMLLCTGTSGQCASRSAEDATRQALGRIEKANATLHAVIATNPLALEEAKRLDRAGANLPLAARTVLLKDNIDMRELPTTAGSTALVANLVGRDAPVVAGLRRAGAVIVGKANMSEWAGFRGDHQIAGWSGVGGQTRNSYDLTRTPGGSSSGSAVAVATGLVDIAIGTDTGGSVIAPASYNGVVGFRASVGRVSRTGIVPIAATFDTVGSLTHTVRDAAMVMDAISRRDATDPASAEAPPAPSFVAGLDPTALRGVRLGVLRFDAATVPQDKALFDRALGVLRAAGAVLIDIPDKGVVPDTGDDERIVMTTEFKAGVDAYLASAAPAVRARSLAALIAFNEAHAATEMPLFGQEVFKQAQAALPPTDPAYRAARRRALSGAGPGFVDRLFRQANVAALIAPTLGPAPHIERVPGEVRTPPPTTAAQSNVAGYPQLTVPMGFVQGLPVGLTFIGPQWSDGQLLAIGNAYELARGKLATLPVGDVAKLRP